MPILFQSSRGRVVKLEDPGAACQAQLFGVQPTIDFTWQVSILTRITMSQGVNVQFLHTLGAMVYIYVFGDRVGAIELSGLAFACPCDEYRLGAEEMYTWYRQNRASRRREPAVLTVGDSTIEGFVTGFTEDVIDPASSLVQWGVSMVTLPEDE